MSKVTSIRKKILVIKKSIGIIVAKSKETRVITYTPAVILVCVSF